MISILSMMIHDKTSLEEHCHSMDYCNTKQQLSRSSQILISLSQLQALKYRSVTDIVRPIRKIVRCGEKGIGPKENWSSLFVQTDCTYVPVVPLCLFTKIVKK